MRGRTYVRVENDRDRQIAVSQAGGLDIRDSQFMHFFSRSVIRFSDNSTLQLPAPSNPCMEIGLRETLSQAVRNRGLIPKGTVVAEGFLDTGDLVLVDKFSYHFRKPKRGEVFVFDTINNEGIRKRSGPQGAGSHYIKRLCGVPGDTISIQSPHLLIDGKVAKEPGIDRVSRGEGEYSINSGGYELAKLEQPQAGGKRLPQYLVKDGDSMTLAAKAPVGMREYAALGDNTSNSLDSRYWGPVKEFNLVGPALFSLWPF
ncbi:MAG: signal peptidase I, partial [Verrucomicrobiaceae bacterium]